MTFSELLLLGKSSLKNIDNCENESIYLLEKASSKTRTRLYLSENDTASEDIIKKYKEYISRRLDGEPVQYILGQWDFYGESFYVGKGTLIPRNETEELIDAALEILKPIECPVIYDLCAGSGCIGLTVARLLPRSTVYLIEKYDEAFYYLEKNLNAFGLKNAFAVKNDICLEETAQSIEKCDLIISNPPYIKSGEIPFLQKEVLQEPLTALDGGSDGLDFYRIIKSLYLKKCSHFLFECGDGQSKDIIDIFEPGTAKITKDFAGIDRIIEIF